MQNLAFRRFSPHEPRVDVFSSSSCRCCGQAFLGERAQQCRRQHELLRHLCGGAINSCEFHRVLSAKSKLLKICNEVDVSLVKATELAARLASIAAEVMPSKISVALASKGGKRKRRVGRPRSSTLEGRNVSRSGREGGEQDGEEVETDASDESELEGESSDLEEDERHRESNESVERAGTIERDGRDAGGAEEVDGAQESEGVESDDDEDAVAEGSVQEGQSMVGPVSGVGETKEKRTEDMLLETLRSRTSLVSACDCKLTENVRSLFRSFLPSNLLSQALSVVLGVGLRHGEWAHIVGVSRETERRRRAKFLSRAESKENEARKSVGEIVLAGECRARARLAFTEAVLTDLNEFLLSQPCSRVHPTRTVGEPPLPLHFMNFSIEFSYELYMEHVVQGKSWMRPVVVEGEVVPDSVTLNELLDSRSKAELQQLLRAHNQPIAASDKKDDMKKKLVQLMGAKPSTTAGTTTSATSQRSGERSNELPEQFALLRKERRAVGLTFFRKAIDGMANLRKAIVDEFACPICREGKVSSASLRRLQAENQASAQQQPPELLHNDGEDERNLEIQYHQEKIATWQKHLGVLQAQAAEYRRHMSWVAGGRDRVVAVMDFTPITKVWRAKRSMAETRAYVECLNITVFRCDESGEVAEHRFDFLATEENDSAFVNSAVRHLFTRSLAGVREARFWCDGARAHFKQKFNINNLIVDVRRRFNFISVTLNFFASYHGKGPCDRHFGVLKRQLHSAACRGRVIQTPEQIAQFASGEVIHTECELFTDSVDRSTAADAGRWGPVVPV